MGDTDYKPTNKKATEMAAKKEAFTRYLEKEGVLEYMIKQLKSLYEEDDRPESALEYLKNSFSGKKDEITELKKDKEKLEEENGKLKQKVKRLELENTNLVEQLKRVPKDGLVLESITTNSITEGSSLSAASLSLADGMEIDAPPTYAATISGTTTSREAVSDADRDFDNLTALSNIKPKLPDSAEFNKTQPNAEREDVGKEKKSSSEKDAENVEIVDLDL